MNNAEEVKGYVWTMAKDGESQVFAMAYKGMPDAYESNFAGPSAYGATCEEAILVALTDAGMHYDEAFDAAVSASWIYVPRG